jgi:hypothetical protein
LGVRQVRCLWWVHVIGRGPGVECLHGMKPKMGGAVMAWGAGCFVERKMGSPCEDILLSHPKDCYVYRPGPRNPYTPTRFCGEETDVRLASAVPLLLRG